MNGLTFGGDSPVRTHGEELHPISIGTDTVLDLFRQATRTLTKISRTFGGESNTDVSQDKLPLLISGEALKDRVAENFFNAAAFAHSCFLAGIKSPAEMERVIFLTTLHANRGLVDESLGFFRSWPGHEGQPAPDNLPQAFSEFASTLLEKLSQSADKVEVAAWIEHTFNAQIHPLSDGCGRVSKALSTAVLALEGKPFPAFANRDEYFSSLLRPLEEFTAIYRGKAV